jgi:hypothetical protein
VAPVRVSPRRARCRHDPTDHHEKTIVIDDEPAFVSYTQMLWIAMKKKAAYLPGC